MIITMASKKQTTKQTKPKFTGYADIDTFINSAQPVFKFSDGEAKGFKAYMEGKYYQRSERDFIPYLESYLGRKLK